MELKIGTKSIKRDMGCQNCQKSQRSIFMQHVISEEVRKNFDSVTERLQTTKGISLPSAGSFGTMPGPYLENIGPAIEHFDWLILVIGRLSVSVV